jgi:hypothetical protein
MLLSFLMSVWRKEEAMSVMSESELLVRLDTLDTLQGIFRKGINCIKLERLDRRVKEEIDNYNYHIFKKTFHIKYVIIFFQNIIRFVCRIFMKLEVPVLFTGLHLNCWCIPEFSSKHYIITNVNSGIKDVKCITGL